MRVQLTTSRYPIHQVHMQAIAKTELARHV